MTHLKLFFILSSLLSFFSIKSFATEESILYVHLDTATELPWMPSSNYISYFTFKNAIHTKASFPSSDKENIVKEVKFVSNNVLEIELFDYLHFIRAEEEWNARSEDFKFTLIRPFLSSKTPTPFKDVVSQIKGFENLNDLKGQENWEKIQIPGLTILSPYKIRLEVKGDALHFAKDFFALDFYLLSPKCFKDDLKEVKDFPCGTGPYKVSFFDKDTGEVKISLRTPYLKAYPLAPRHVVFQKKENNEGDIYWKDMWPIDKSYYERHQISHPFGTFGFFFNFQTKLGSSQAFREAISAVLDRKELTDGFDYLKANDTLIPHGKVGHVDLKNLNKYNPKKAQKIIKKHWNGKLEVDCEVYGQSDDALSKPYFTKIQSQLKEVGILLRFTKPNPAFKYKTPLFLAGFAHKDFKDPKFVYSFLRKGSVFKNAYPPKDPTFENLFQKLNLHPPKSWERMAYYVAQKNYMIPLWDLYPVYFSRKSKVKSIGNQKESLSLSFLEIQMIENPN
jgi:hypothetical protein